MGQGKSKSVTGYTGVLCTWQSASGVDRVHLIITVFCGGNLFSAFYSFPPHQEENTQNIELSITIASKLRIWGCIGM